MENVPQAPAGWHPDPSGVHQLRYWDGQVWTHHVAPHPVPQVVAAPNPDAGRAYAPEAPAADAAHDPAARAAKDSAAYPARSTSPDPMQDPAAHPTRNTDVHGAQYPAGTAGEHPMAGAPGQYPMGQYPAGQYPMVPRPPREKAMTGGTWAVLVATVVVVGGALGALGWGAASSAQSISAEAPEVVDGFLAATTTGDPSWSNYVNPGLAAGSASAPWFGDAAAAESIGLTIDYEVSDLLYGARGLIDGPQPAAEGSDTAQVMVDLTYTFTVDGAEQTATSTQAVWLSRPYYYGDETPSQLRYEGEGTPTAVGPWRVAGITAPRESDLGGRQPALDTSFTPTDESGCDTAPQILVEMSEVARTEGFLGAICLSGGDRTNIGEDVDVTALGSTFPVLTDQSPLEEMIGIGETYDERAPLSEYRVTAGDQEYVFVFAAAGIGGQRSSDSGVRVISIQKAEAR